MLDPLQYLAISSHLFTLVCPRGQIPCISVYYSVVKTRPHVATFIYIHLHSCTFIYIPDCEWVRLPFTQAQKKGLTHPTSMNVAKMSWFKGIQSGSSSYSKVFFLHCGIQPPKSWRPNGLLQYADFLTTSDCWEGLSNRLSGIDLGEPTSPSRPGRTMGRSKRPGELSQERRSRSFHEHQAGWFTLWMMCCSLHPFAINHHL